MIVKHPVDPPTHPDDVGDEEEQRSFLYKISDDRTHYEFVGECETTEDMADALSDMPQLGSDKIAAMVVLWWYPGDKVNVQGQPWPTPDPPPYEGLRLAED